MTDRDRRREDERITPRDVERGGEDAQDRPRPTDDEETHATIWPGSKGAEPDKRGAATAGAAIGAVAGAPAGPPGAIAGAAIGALGGAVVGEEEDLPESDVDDDGEVAEETAADRRATERRAVEPDRTAD